MIKVLHNENISQGTNNIEIKSNNTAKSVNL